jgi:hypothetical protein
MQRKRYNAYHTANPHEEYRQMADAEQLERLKRSVDEWNKWRRKHPEIYPDLSEAKLSHVDLSSAYFTGANRRGANLSSTNLSGADLSYVNLRYANLQSANLNNADLGYATLRHATLSSSTLSNTILREADLGGANLKSANLSGANLSESNLSNTNLSDANFNQTIFYRSFFAWVDLSTVKGLETATHVGPSSVDISSVSLPHDEPTRLHFLRGVGFTETQIEYLPSLLTPRPIQYSSLFISYTSQDDVIAQRLYTDLRKKDVPCWFAPHDLQPGNYFRERIDKAIHSQDKLLLLLSEHSVKSGWVRYEVELALSRENRELREFLFPIRLDDAIFDCTANWAVSLQATRHIGDFTGWQDDAAYRQAFTTLLRHLKIAKPPTASS